MEHIAIVVPLYVAVAIFYIRPLFKKGDRSALWVAIPVFTVTLLLNVLFGFGVTFPSVNDGIRRIISLILGEV